MKRIENVQKRALQIVFNDRISDYTDLLKKANTCIIETRWKRQLRLLLYRTQLHSLEGGDEGSAPPPWVPLSQARGLTKTCQVSSPPSPVPSIILRKQYMQCT